MTSNSNTEKTVEVPLEPFKLDILNLIASQQSQNGVKLNDYPRYKNYCSNKIHKLTNN